MPSLRVLVLAAALAVVACAPEAPRFRSTDITGASYGKQLSLKDTSGRERSLADFRGKIVVLFFGFTQCPDVCPTTLGQIAGVLKQLGPDAGRVQAVFVTVDPERDTPQLIERYLSAFGPSFVGLRGDLDATRRTAREFKVFFEKRSSSDPTRYSVDHSSQSYVIDAQGRLRLFVQHARISEDLLEDLKTLLKEAPRG